jgi:hypothetical protein
MALDFGMSARGRAIWFGILVLIVVEVGLITPPVGMNLFIINSVTAIPRPQTRQDLVRMAGRFGLPGRDDVSPQAIAHDLEHQLEGPEMHGGEDDRHVGRQPGADQLPALDLHPAGRPQPFQCGIFGKNLAGAGPPPAGGRGEVRCLQRGIGMKLAQIKIDPAGENPPAVPETGQRRETAGNQRREPHRAPAQKVVKSGLEET